MTDTRHLYKRYQVSSWQRLLGWLRRLGLRIMPDRWANMAFGIDISRYQKITPADWLNLKNLAKIDFVFAKASEGIDWIDPAFTENVQNAYEADIPLMAYHYFRTGYYVEYGHDTAKWPKAADDKQLNNFKRALANKKYYALVIDVEDTTESIPWGAWAAGVFAGRVRDWLDSIGRQTTPLIVYTGEWYWVQAKAEFSWMTKYLLWIAKYPYASGAVTTTWEALRENYFPPGTTAVPTLGNAQWNFWQFSGDKFILPYVTNANGGPTALDLNLYNGTRDALYKLINFTPSGGTPPVDPPVEPPSNDELEARVAELEAAAGDTEARLSEVERKLDAIKGIL